MTDTVAYGAVALSLVAVLAYEGHLLWLDRRMPHRLARTAHARMRVQWARLLATQAGFEIIAVQTLRNALMSATILASAAMLALMGSINLLSSHLLLSGPPLVTITLQVLLMLTLFAAFVCSALATRLFNHASFIVSLPAGSALRLEWNEVAVSHVERAGLLYSWGIRCFLCVAPLVAGLLQAGLMPPATLVLLLVMHVFDRTTLAPPLDSRT